MEGAVDRADALSVAAFIVPVIVDRTMKATRAGIDVCRKASGTCTLVARRPATRTPIYSTR